MKIEHYSDWREKKVAYVDLKGFDITTDDSFPDLDTDSQERKQEMLCVLIFQIWRKQKLQVHNLLMFKWLHMITHWLQVLSLQEHHLQVHNLPVLKRIRMTTQWLQVLRLQEHTLQEPLKQNC